MDVILKGILIMQGFSEILRPKDAFFEQLQGADYEQAARQINDDGLLGIFHGNHSLGCIIHMPNPRHWVAIVSPISQTSVEVAGLLCDSLQNQIYALTVDEMVSLFTNMGLRHAQYADMQIPLQVREELAAGWSAYRVTH